MYTNNVLNAHVNVQRPWWYYEQSLMLRRAFDFDAIANLPIALPFKMSLTWKYSKS